MQPGIIGHEKVISYLLRAKEQNRLHHAYCLVGPEHIGKTTVAQTVAAEIMGVPFDHVLRHPDVTVVVQEIQEKKEKMKKHIDVDQVRSLRATLSHHSLLGGYKIAIIDGAEKMNSAAANALLKTLEEPRRKTILFLTVIDETALPVTIQSRCHLLYLAPVSTKAIQEWLAADGVHAKHAERLARLSAGRAGLAKLWQQDPTVFASYEQDIEQFQTVWGQSLHEQFSFVEKICAESDDAVVGRERLATLMKVWRMLIRDRAYQMVGLTQFAINASPVNSGSSMKTLIRIDTAITGVLEYIDKNVHPRLLLEQVMLAMHS